jgi:hypothetical protein
LLAVIGVVGALIGAFEWVDAHKPPAIDEQKFGALYRAGKAMEGGVAVGITYAKFGERLQDMATELSIANEKAHTEAERELVAAYGQALSTFSRALLAWNAKIEGDREAPVDGFLSIGVEQLEKGNKLYKGPSPNTGQPTPMADTDLMESCRAAAGSTWGARRDEILETCMNGKGFTWKDNRWKPLLP